MKRDYLLDHEDVMSPLHCRPDYIVDFIEAQRREGRAWPQTAEAGYWAAVRWSNNPLTIPSDYDMYDLDAAYMLVRAICEYYGWRIQP